MCKYWRFQMLTMCKVAKSLNYYAIVITFWLLYMWVYGEQSKEWEEFCGSGQHTNGYGWFIDH